MPRLYPKFFFYKIVGQLAQYIGKYWKKETLAQLLNVTAGTTLNYASGC